MAWKDISGDRVCRICDSFLLVEFSVNYWGWVLGGGGEVNALEETEFIRRSFCTDYQAFDNFRTYGIDFEEDVGW